MASAECPWPHHLRILATVRASAEMGRDSCLGTGRVDASAHCAQPNQAPRGASEHEENRADRDARRLPYSGGHLRRSVTVWLWRRYRNLRIGRVRAGIANV